VASQEAATAPVAPLQGAPTRAPWQSHRMGSRTELPPYVDLTYPTLRAVAALSRSAQAREITSHLMEDMQFSDEQLALTYPNREKPLLIDRMDWARSYSKLGGARLHPVAGHVGPQWNVTLRIVSPPATKRFPI
jgi:hypothetical protein